MPTWRSVMEPNQPDDEPLDETDIEALQRDFPHTWDDPYRPSTRGQAENHEFWYAEGLRRAYLESGLDPDTGEPLTDEDETDDGDDREDEDGGGDEVEAEDETGNEGHAVPPAPGSDAGV